MIQKHFQLIGDNAKIHVTYCTLNVLYFFVTAVMTVDEEAGQELGREEELELAEKAADFAADLCKKMMSAKQKKGATGGKEQKTTEDEV